MKRTLLSLLLIFHLFAVLVTPNARSYLYLSARPIIKPYLDALGMGHTWAFFAPEPVFTPMYLDYVVEFKSGDPLRLRFPEETNPYFFRDRYNRRMNLSHFIMNSEDNWKNMLVSHLCHQHRDVSSVKLWRISSQQPTIEMVQAGTRKMTESFDDKIEVLGSYFCAEEANAKSGT